MTRKPMSLAEAYRQDLLEGRGNEIKSGDRARFQAEEAERRKIAERTEAAEVERQIKLARKVDEQIQAMKERGEW